MSLVFGSREVSVGPTVGFQGDVRSQSTTSAYVDELSKLSSSSSSNSFSMISSNGGEEKDKLQRRRISCLSVDPDLASFSDNEGLDDDNSDNDDDDVKSRSTTEVGEEDENEIRSKFKGSLCSMESLEDSLPIKRGLSNFFTGKSKSFANLSDATTVSSLEKIENPFNKKRRTLIACKWSRSGTFYSSVEPVSMPLLTLNEDEEQEQSDVDQESDKNNNNNDDEDEDSDNSISYFSSKHERKIKSFKPTSCFSFTDLHHNHQL